MDNEFDIIIQHIKTHFTPSELVEFLGVNMDHLLSFGLLDVIEENLGDIREEIGL